MNDNTVITEAMALALLRFAGEMLSPFPESIGDIEGLQEIAESAGLVMPRVVSNDDPLTAAAWGEWECGTTIYFLTPLGQTAVDAAKQARAVA